MATGYDKIRKKMEPYELFAAPDTSIYKPVENVKVGTGILNGYLIVIFVSISLY